MRPTTAIFFFLFAMGVAQAQTKFPLAKGSTFVQDHEDSTGKYRVVYQYGNVPANLSAEFTIDTLGKRSQPTGADATVLVFKRQPNGRWKLVGNAKTAKQEHPVKSIQEAKLQ